MEIDRRKRRDRGPRREPHAPQRCGTRRLRGARAGGRRTHRHGQWLAPAACAVVAAGGEGEVMPGPIGYTLDECVRKLRNAVRRHDELSIARWIRGEVIRRDEMNRSHINAIDVANALEKQMSVILPESSTGVAIER